MLNTAAQKKRKTPEPAGDGPAPAGSDARMDGAEHVHAFGTPTKAAAGYTCGVCRKKKAKGQLRLECEGCDVSACKTCTS
ncbi:hypothetical protein DIPPA_26554 [Diplonema papillatum]|nr:hypothetical protein DIPPA_26554 [Diplonema papillatum]